MESESPRADKKKIRRRRRIIAYGSIFTAIWLFWLWVPWEYDFIPRRIPTPNLQIDPESGILFSPNARILVVTAHPDDSEFYIGGTLTKLAAKGAKLFHVVITDGDKGYYPFEDATANRKVRRQEQEKASGTWKAQEIVFLGFPDGRLRARPEVVERLTQEFARIKPDYILAFDYDFPPRLSHGDHRKAGESVKKALELNPHLCQWLLCYSTLAPNYVVDMSDEWPAKVELLKIHASQFNGEKLEFVKNMVEESAIEDGTRIDATYGEGFRAIRMK